MSGSACLLGRVDESPCITQGKKNQNTPASVSMGRRSLTPHCLGGARSLLALCPSNVCSGRGGNLEALPETAREKKTNPFF